MQKTKLEKEKLSDKNKLINNILKSKKKTKKDIKNMQKTILEKEQNNVKNQLINNLFSTFNSFQNYYNIKELKEIYEYIKK